MPKRRREIAREVAAILNHATKPARLASDLTAALTSMAEEAESDASENLYLGRHDLGYSGDPKEFRFSQIFADRLPNEKYNRLLEIIAEFRHQVHDRLGRPLTDHEADRLEQEARKIRDEEVAYLNHAIHRKSMDSRNIERARKTSERRIAALIANKEDVRNSPAWRDAVSERETIEFMSRVDAPPGRRQFGIDRSKHTRVDIRWYAIPNQNKASGGFLPMIEEDGRPRSATWASRGYAKADAEAMAEEKAHEAASRFLGDWNVVVKKGRPPRP